MASVPADRRGRFQVKLVFLRLFLAQRHGDLPAVIEEAQRLLAPAEVPDAAQPGQGEEVRGMALVTLGAAELWAFRTDEAERGKRPPKRGSGRAGPVSYRMNMTSAGPSM
jgi:LuxR family maltose regulon positive regulatory protein